MHRTRRRRRYRWSWWNATARSRGHLLVPAAHRRVSCDERVRAEHRRSAVRRPRSSLGEVTNDLADDPHRAEFAVQARQVYRLHGGGVPSPAVRPGRREGCARVPGERDAEACVRRHAHARRHAVRRGQPRDHEPVDAESPVASSNDRSRRGRWRRIRTMRSTSACWRFCATTRVLRCRAWRQRCTCASPRCAVACSGSRRRARSSVTR